MSQIILAEQAAAPSTPSAGKATLYVDTTPEIRLKDDAGNVIVIPKQLSGTWTPTIAGSSTPGSHTYTRQIGRYTKTGTQVHVIFYVTINAKDGTMAGNVQIAGLPFTTKNVSNALQTGTIASWGALATAMVNVSIYTNTNATTAPILKATAATASLAAMVAADIQNGSEFVGSISYEADS